MAPFKSRTDDCFVDVEGLAPLTDGWIYTAIPILDRSEVLSDGETPICAQIDDQQIRELARRWGGRLATPSELEYLHELSTRGECIELPAFVGTPTAETSLYHRRISDETNRANARRKGYVRGKGMRLCNFGKHVVEDEEQEEEVWLMGWFVERLQDYSPTRRGPGFIQPRPAKGSRGAHTRGTQADDGMTAILVFPVGWKPPTSMPTFDSKPKEPPPVTTTAAIVYRPTLRLGSKGPHVSRVQEIVGANVDGDWGPKTDRSVKGWQRVQGLEQDMVFGRKSWNAAGEKHESERPGNKPQMGGYPGDAPACRAALRDADAAFPKRNRRSDGIPGDLAHQFKPGPDGKLGTADDVPNNSDHNIGNAVDITHDPANGCDGNEIVKLAITDSRLQYAIWNRKIWNADRPGWRPYTGKNGHTHHVHLSIKASMRDDDRPWAWAPGQPPPEGA